MDFRQSEPFAKYLESSGWKTTRLSDGTYVYIFNFPILGAFLRIPRPKLPLHFSEIDQLAKKYHACAIKIEPDAESSDNILKEHFLQNGYRFDSWSIEPTNTLVVDLKLSEGRLLKDLKPKWRQYVKFAKKHKIIIQKSEDISSFVNVWQKNAKRKGFLVESVDQIKAFYSSLKKKDGVKLYNAVYDNQTVASAFLIFWGQTCYLWHLGYDGQYPNLRPLYLLVWESIIFAKKKDYKYFDFEGIEDKRFPYSKKTQPSFFKKGFGGKEKIYPGSYIYFLNPIAALAYKIISLINPGLFRIFVKSRP